jgi:hypothetical protein
VKKEVYNSALFGKISPWVAAMRMSPYKGFFVNEYEAAYPHMKYNFIRYINALSGKGLEWLQSKVTLV